jgi:uncharacterized membrane protein
MVVLARVKTAVADVQYSFTTIDVPGGTGPFGTSAMGINNSGQIVGSYFVSNGHHYHGFLDTGGSLTTIDVSGSTGANGIKDSGHIVGGLLRQHRGPWFPRHRRQLQHKNNEN